MYERFIEKAKEVHNNKYDYSKSKYINSKTKLTIICPIHGEFEQSANSHLKGRGCPQCGLNKIRNSGSNYVDSFIKKCKKKFNDKYDYSQINYINTNHDVIIVCPDHGEFRQKPINHLRYGCILCSEEKRVNKEKQKFIKRANKKHNDKYDYSKIKYADYFTKITIICPIHGEFEQSPRSHLQYGCKQCGHVQSRLSISTTKQEFMERANKKHNNKYNYSNIKYINLSSKLKIICPVHGEFTQTARNHLKYGCLKCGTESLALGADKFIKKAKEIHNNRYNYSKVNYKNSHTKVIMVCQDHGEFEQIPSCHLNGRGCPKCSEHTINDFIKKAVEVHGDKYDYSKVDYKDKKTKVTIICPTHGEFEQKPCLHIDGKNCQKCAKENLSSNTAEFIEKAKIKHGAKYDYSKVDYTHNRLKVIIICPTHGEFLQVPMDHLQGCGCPRCGIIISSGHQEIIDFIKFIDPNIELKINDREAIKPNELDIYIPQYNFAIEYHGLYWHSYDRPESIPERKKHQQKHKLCLDQNMKLFQIFENEWASERTRNILKSKIRLALNLSDKIYARKCVAKEITGEEYKEFITFHHLQGHKTASVRLGLFHQDELVSVMSFNKHPKYEWEITRFASKLDLIAVGGASKVFQYFINNYDPNQILTYADCRYSNGNLYRKLGFGLDGITQPNYYYIKDDQIFSRQQFQKHKLHKKLESFNPVQTETENMFNNGYRRMWDAGHFRFIWSRDQGKTCCV